jgi:hypothetical protein
VVSYHTHIYGPVRGATTHENRATMSLYGYGRAQYVVEFSLGIPTSCDGRTTGMFGEAAMAEPWDGVGTSTMAGTHKAQEGTSGWV